MATATFSVGGLATGLDTNSIIDKLVQLATTPLTRLQSRQAAFNTQVSTLGSIASALSALKTATQSLGDAGALGAKTTSTNTAFTATPGSSAAAGSYDVQVGTLAAAAKWRSAAFAPTDTVRGGTLTLTANGTDHDIAIADGTTLSDVAFAIRQSGAPVSASVLNDGTNNYLSVTASTTGFTGATAASALQISFSESTSNNKTLGFAQTQAASNATFTVDGLSFSRTTNTVADAIPGTTLVLKQGGGASETLTLANDTDSTKARLQTFVDAFNSVMRLVQAQLNVTKDTDRSKTLAGDPTIRNLQGSLQQLTWSDWSNGALKSGSTTDPLYTVRTLADVGVKIASDGSLSIDSTVLASAMSREPASVNQLFSDATYGISKLTTSLVDSYAAPTSGLLSLRQSGIRSQIRQMDTQVANLELRIESYRDLLVKQFTAMETVVSGLKNSSTYLSSLSAYSSD